MGNKGLRILRVEVENFRGYEGKLVYNLSPESKVFLLSGPNGYGKTTFFDSVEWVLTGEISRIKENIDVKKDKKNPTEQSLINNISNRSKEEFAQVTLSFILDNKFYEIKRESITYKQDYLKDNTKLLLKLKDKSKEIEITQEWIDELFKEKDGASYKLSEKFSSYHLCSHEKNLKILQKNRESIHGMLSILFGENKFSLYRDNSKKLLDEVAKRVKEKENEYNILHNSGKQALGIKEFGSLEKHLDSYNKWLLPNEMEINFETVLKTNLSERQISLVNILNFLKQKDQYINYKKYLEYKTKEKKYNFFIKGIEEKFEKIRDIVEEENFSFSRLEKERSQLLYFQNKIQQMFEQLKSLEVDNVEEEHLKTITEFKEKYSYQLKEINLGEIWDLFSQIKKIADFKKQIRIVQEQKLQFEEQNSDFINFIEYIKKHIESSHSTNECPLCNQEIPIETLKSLIEQKHASFSIWEIKVASLKDEYKLLKSEALILINKFNKEVKLILRYIEKGLKEYLDKLQRRTEFEEFKDNLSRYELDIHTINEESLKEFREKIYVEFINSSKLVKQEDFITTTITGVNNFILKYEEKQKRYQGILGNVNIEIVQNKLNSLEKIIENNNYVLYKQKIEDIQSQLDKLKEQHAIIKKIKNNVYSAVNELEKKYKNELEEPINYVYKKINRHSNFTKINMSLPSGRSNKKVDATVGNKDSIVNLSNVLSSGQITTVALSFFLGIAFKKRFSKFNSYFFDDPIQHMDDLNILSFIDLLRVHLTDEDFANQIFISTCNEDMDNLLVSKMKHFNIGLTKYVFNNYAEFEQIPYKS